MRDVFVNAFCGAGIIVGVAALIAEPATIYTIPGALFIAAVTAVVILLVVRLFDPGDPS